MQKFLILLISFFYFQSSGFAENEFFLTLRYDIVNLSQGPTKEYPIKIFYKKKFLPVLIQDRSDNFRKIRDHENNTGWIHVSQLSKKKAALVFKDSLILFKKPTVYSKPIVKIEKGRLIKIINCKETWCKVKTSKYKGWLKKEGLWGRL